MRNPHSTRPYQHVLEPVYAYLLLAQKQFEDRKYAGSYNIGPDDCDCLTTGALVDLFCQTWQDQTKMPAAWINRYDGGPHEANFLKLDCSKAKSILGWHPAWHVETAMEKIIEFAYNRIQGQDIAACMEAQIEVYLAAMEKLVIAGE